MYSEEMTLAISQQSSRSKGLSWTIFFEFYF